MSAMKWYILDPVVACCEGNQNAIEAMMKEIHSLIDDTMYDYRMAMDEIASMIEENDFDLFWNTPNSTGITSWHIPPKNAAYLRDAFK